MSDVVDETDADALFRVKVLIERMTVAIGHTQNVGDLLDACISMAARAATLYGVSEAVFAEVARQAHRKSLETLPQSPVKQLSTRMVRGTKGNPYR